MHNLTEIEWDLVSLHEAARRVQQKLLAERKCPDKPVFRLVQEGWIPSQREIRCGLIQGAYQEYLENGKTEG